MVSTPTCSRCRSAARPGSRFCPHCGSALESAASLTVQPGLAAHPHPLPAPAGFRPWRRGTDLYYRWQHGADGPVLGAEALTVTLFNAGYPIADVSLNLRGVDSAGREVFNVERQLDKLPHAAMPAIEVPSYELPGEVSDVTVSLVSARFDIAAP